MSGKRLKDITEADMRTLFYHIFPDTPEDADFKYEKGGAITGELVFRHESLSVISGCRAMIYDANEKKSYDLHLGELYKLEQMGYDVFSEWREE